MSASAPAPLLSTASRSRLFQLRFMEAAGVQFGYLLAPLLALTLTKSLVLLGVSLLFDALARALAMSFSGAMLSREGGARVHLVNESVRGAALLLMLLVALGLLPPAFVVLGAFGVQLATASSLTLYAHAITVGWPVQEQAQAHHKQAYLDQAGCLLALGIGLAGTAPWLMALAAVAVQAVTLGALLRWRSVLHPAVAAPAARLPVWQQMQRDFKACQNRPIRLFAIASMLIGAAALVGLSTPSFLVHQTGVSLSQVGAWLSGAMLLKVVLAMAVLHATKKQVRSFEGAVRTSKFGLGLVALGLVGQALASSPWVVVAATATMGIGVALLLPHLRHVRQLLITRTTPPAAHAGATGLLSAWDATGFALAGLVLIGLESPVWALACAVALAGVSAVLLLRTNRWLALTR